MSLLDRPDGEYLLRLTPNGPGPGGTPVWTWITIQDKRVTDTARMEPWEQEAAEQAHRDREARP